MPNAIDTTEEEVFRFVQSGLRKAPEQAVFQEGCWKVQKGLSVEELGKSIASKRKGRNGKMHEIA